LDRKIGLVRSDHMALVYKFLRYTQDTYLDK